MIKYASLILLICGTTLYTRFFFSKFPSYLHVRFPFTATRNVNEKVFHDSILLSHWRKLRNRHNNGKLCSLESCSKSTLPFSFSLCFFLSFSHTNLSYSSRNRRSRAIFKTNYDCTSHFRILWILSNLHFVQSFIYFRYIGTNYTI